MKVVITGAAGFLGRKLTQALLEGGTLAGPGEAAERIDKLVLFDSIAPPATDDPRVETRTGDVADPAAVAAAIGDDAGTIFHLAAVVSGAAEADFDLGYRVNLDGTRNVLEAARRLGHRPRVLFTSSIAVYGGTDLPAVVTDETPLTPLTSYGAAKSIGEFLVSDYSRKGFIDGRAVRLPTICVRRGKPNKAASTWVSSMIREPLCGIDAVCPVTPESAMACLSPRRAIESFLIAHDLPAKAFGDWRTLLLNGITVTAAEIAEAVERRGNEHELGRIVWRHDPSTQKIVDGWPKGCRSERSARLGFTADGSIDEIIDAFIADDLAAQKAGID